MRPTLHRGMTMGAYLALDAASASLMHVLNTMTAAHAHVYQTEARKDTKALILGEATHYAVLEPQLFKVRYGVPPKGDMRTNVAKKSYADWVEANPNLVPLTDEEYAAAHGMLSATAAHGKALRYLDGPGINETTMTWTDKETGLACKARPDRITPVDGHTFVVDIKTCRSAAPWMFSKAVGDYGYHNKAAWYLDALNLLEPRERQFLFVAVENSAPYLVALYLLTDDALAQGREENRRALRLFAECKKSGVWPGYPNEISYIDLPKYKQRQVAA